MTNRIPTELITIQVLDDLYQALIQYHGFPFGRTFLWGNLDGTAAVVADAIVGANAGNVPTCPDWPEVVTKLSANPTFMRWCVWLGRNFTDFSGSRRKMLLLLFKLNLLPEEVPT